MNIKAAFTVLALTLAACLPARAALELKEGDSIIVVGNTFAERIALSGYLDAMLHAANPDKKLEIRSVPNSADEVDMMIRETNVPPADFYLKRHGADVVIMCFGMSESFDGLGGVEQFKTDLAGQVDHHLKANYNGESSPKIVLVSPIAHEDLGGNWPTGQAVVQRNATLKAYTEAMKAVADEKGAVFVDLFTVSNGTHERPDAMLTSNGIAPNELGCFYYAGEMAKQLGWWDGKTAAGADQAAATLREAAYDKHYHFRHRYRATNTEYVWGRRHKPFGNVNFPPELDHLDKMVATREKAMHELGKPTLGQLFAKAPTGKAIWETTPTTYDFPGDEWPGVELPEQKTKRAVGDASGILPAEDNIPHLKVADGYQVNVFASEADFVDENGVKLLANPLAMTFDYKGRLWVLCSPTYPHPYPGEVTDCRLLILDDTDNDGKADKCTVFARHMNIPTCFVIDANGVAYIGQAPDLWKFTDTDGDDVADRKEMIYSGFGMADSHHTVSAAVWDPHGGILMSEGVFTRTNIETPWGTERTRDAAVWRFDPRTNKLLAISHTNHPNPWGQTFDEFGQSIYMDTSGAAQYNFSSLIIPFTYPDKTPKGPAVVKRGRPAAGCEFIYSRHFPDDVQGTYVHSQCIGFLGTNWDRLDQDGSNNSGYTSKPMPQPILYADTRAEQKMGNYRPVCSELGADGALYIADWVNPLIGHMQFNLRDPRRDHTHGRIYRVTHKERPLVEKLDLTKMSIEELLETFKLPEQNTRDRARRLLQTMDADKVAKAAEDWLYDQNPREDWYERAALEVLWVQQGVDRLSMKIVDEALRAREPLVQAGVIRALRMGLQFGDLSTQDCLPFISSEVTNRDMRVRLEAVMACAYLDDPGAADIANRVTEQAMDGVVRNAHERVIKYLAAKGIVPGIGQLPGMYIQSTDDLLKLHQEDTSNPLVTKVILARPDVPLETRQQTLEQAKSSPEERAKLLMQLTKVAVFDPARTAKSITPLLLEMPDAAVFAISSDLDGLLTSTSPELRSTAVILKVRAGASLAELAEIDSKALLSAIASLPEGGAPSNVPSDLLDLAAAGKIEIGMAFEQAARLASDYGTLFTSFTALIDAAKEIDFETWSSEHRLAMAALAAMHSVDDSDWPEGFDAYRVARADPERFEIGREYYFEHEKGCVKCHGPKGEGTEGFPPLAGSPWIVGSPERAATIVKYGLMGELKHMINPSDGKPFNAQMEPLSYMGDGEIAAVLTFVRQSWGNFAEPVTLEHVTKAKAPAGGENMWPADALLAKFPFKRDRLLGSLPGPELKVAKWSPPAAGLYLMLGGVTVVMLLILLGTYFGGGPVEDEGSHTPMAA